MFTLRVRSARVFRDQARRQAYATTLESRAGIGHEAAGEARSDAPVLTGAFRDGIGVEVDGLHVAIVDSDPDAIYKEYGTSDTPAHATLTNAASRFGRYSGWRPR